MSHAGYGFGWVSPALVIEQEAGTGGSITVLVQEVLTAKLIVFRHGSKDCFSREVGKCHAVLLDRSE